MKIFCADGLVDCEDPECCENPVCERSQLCHTVSAPIGEIVNQDENVFADAVDAVDGVDDGKICHADFEWHAWSHKH